MRSYFSIAFMLLAVGGGISVAVQQAINANLRTAVGSPWWTGFISFVCGSLTMLIAALVSRDPFATGFRGEGMSWVFLTGGVFGAIYVSSAIVTTRNLGISATIGFIIVGQMLGALVLDHFGLLGVAVKPIDAMRVAGAAFLLVGAVLVRS